MKSSTLTILKILSLGLLATLVAYAPPPSLAQQAEDEAIEEVVVTGTRIRAPGLISSSPVHSIGSDEILKQQEPEVEKILRLLPITIPGDNQNVNNGTGGAATVNLRALGSNRSIVLMDGQRIIPATLDGAVDVSSIPTALIDRVDILTGGGSSVYGSDAIAGAINFVLKRDFEGVDLRINRTAAGSDTDGVDGATGKIDSMSLTLGANLENDAGNVVFNLNYTDREPLLLAALPFGQAIINTGGNAMGRNPSYESYLAGNANVAPSDSGCAGPGANDHVNGSGSSFGIIPTGISLAGVYDAQFRNDGTLGTRCARFNYNPYNYFQTPQEKYSALAIGNFSVTDELDVYSRVGFTHTTIIQQIAPTGLFADAFWVPVSNPLIGSTARATIIAEAEKLRASSLAVLQPNWRDVNENNMVDAGDYLQLSVRRRALELGLRESRYENDYFQMVAGVRGDFMEHYNYDISYSYGQANRSSIDDKYLNKNNVGLGLDVVADDDGNPVCVSGGSCVPVNLFGGFGTLTGEMVNYINVGALQNSKYVQTIFSASVGGEAPAIQLAHASSPLAFNVGYEVRDEEARSDPDSCLQENQGDGCLGGGAGTLPVAGGFHVNELFAEAVLPIADDTSWAYSLRAEAGYRISDYGEGGSHDTWKMGVNWYPTQDFLVRIMQQQAIRAPSISEIAAPQEAALGNADGDPCSVGNIDSLRTGIMRDTDGNITNHGTLLDNELVMRCRDAGARAMMADAQIGVVEDIAAGQVDIFSGTDPNNLPSPETADTFTVGLVWTPGFSMGALDNFQLSVDYYDIYINDIIGPDSAQTILDQCYENGNQEACNKIRRTNGSVRGSGAGVEIFTSNLDYLHAAGVEYSYKFDISMGEMGNLNFSGSINQYLTQEGRDGPNDPVRNCKGLITTDCGGNGGGGAVHDFRWVQRATWDYNEWSVSLQWRHLGALTVADDRKASVFHEFQNVSAYNYLDLYANYTFWNDRASVSMSLDNIGGEEPPILGDTISSTAFNNGNTLPSYYDIYGTVMKLGFRLTL